MHPFGCEAETSLQDLFGYFKRCLQQGEWELAGACVSQLLGSTGGLSEDLRDIIRAIISHPYSLKWETVGSPHRLAWFWLQVLEKWTEEQVSPHIRRELEFLLLLEELGSEGIPETALKELHQAFLASEPERGAAVESCLLTLLEKKKPRLAHTLAHFFQDQSCAGGHSLQHVFTQHLMRKLEKPERRAERAEEWVEDVYAELALMPWSSGSDGGQLEALCEALWAARDGPLKEERVLGALLRPRCDTLVSVYCSTALRLQRDHLLRSSPEMAVDLPEAEKLALSLCCHKDRPSAWKTIFFECLSSGKHFLEQVLMTALDLIKHEEFCQLKQLLQLELRPLSRLLLLLGWTQCRSLASAQTLLSVLHKEQAAAGDSVLRDFADLLSSQLEILEWCKSNNPRVSTEALLAQLHTLDSHSALYILHSLTPLTRFEERRILDLLQQLPRSSETGDVNAAAAAASLGVQRNVVLFQGFCAMKYAIYALCVNAHKYSNCTECEFSQHHQPSETETDQTKTSASSEGGDFLFQHFLSECQLYLETVPAVLRLELLENIFSLLFLSSSDFSQQVPGDADLDAGNDGGPAAAPRGHLDLGHLVRGCRGFLVDVTAMEGFLKLLKEGLEGMCVVGQQEGLEAGRALPQEAEAAASLGCSVSAETFGSRLQRLSKRTAEAQWRLQIVTSNQGAGDGELHTFVTVTQRRPAPRPPDLTAPAPAGSESPVQMSGFGAAVAPLGRSSSSSLRRRRKPVRHAAERQTSVEKHNGEVHTSASDGGGGPAAGSAEPELCPCGVLTAGWSRPCCLPRSPC